MIEALRGMIGKLDLPARLDPDGGVILIGKDRDPFAKVAYVFVDPQGEAAVVAKVARDAASEPALEREDAALRRLHATQAPVVLASAPHPLALERLGGRLVLVTSALPGVPLATRYYQPGHTSDPRRVAEDFDAVGAWLRRFHRETSIGTARIDPETVGRWVGAAFARYRDEIGWSPTEGRLFEAVSERAEALSGCPVPLTAVHGDLSLGNLLMGDGAVAGVVDWELGDVAGPPFRDLYKFPTSYAFYLDRAYPSDARAIPGHPGWRALGDRWSRFGDWKNLRGFGYAYFGRGWFPEQIRRFILQHLEHLGLPPAVNAVFFPTFLAEQAVTLVDPAFRAGYRSLLHAFWEERSSTWLWRRWGEPTGQTEERATPEPVTIGEP